jgi:hypothetical protein
LAGYCQTLGAPLSHRQGEIKTPPRADVLILIEGRREVIVDALLPVYRHLAARGVSVALAATGGANQLPAPAYYLQPRSRLFPPGWAKDSWSALRDSVEQLDGRSLQRSFNNFSSNMEGLYEGLGRMLNDVEPRVVLVASTQLPAGAGLIIESRKRGMTTLLLQHGVLQPLYLPLIADYMMTWGESSTETLVRLGVAPHRLVSLGSPRHDSMLLPGDKDAGRVLLQTLGLRQKPTFVFFSNGNDPLRNGTAPRECALWLETTAAQLANEINIVVRLHPNEDGSLYRDCPTVHLTKDTPELSVVLKGCDFVGSLCSTVLYDALLFKKPVWQFYADGWPELADNWRQGLALRISSQAELSKKLLQFSSKTGTQGDEVNASQRVFANQGRAAEAVASYIQEIVGGQVDSGR